MKQKNQRIICVIPARLGSTRFPRKILALLADKPVVQWVYETAVKTNIFDEVIVAVDAEETANVVAEFGANWVMTSPNHQSGTDRLIEVMQSGVTQGDVWVNWQADEPLISQEMICSLLSTINDRTASIWTLKKKVSPDEANSPHVVKVVTDHLGRALYFSRALIPHSRDGDQSINYYKHIGLYAYSTDALKKIASLTPSFLEEQEKLEQLRFLENGLSIQVHETNKESIGIDLKEHLKEVESFLISRVK